MDAIVLQTQRCQGVCGKPLRIRCIAVAKTAFFIGCGTFAKDMDVRSKRCGASANKGGVKTQVGCNRKGGVESQRHLPLKRKGSRSECGQNAKDIPRKLCESRRDALSVLPMNLSIAIKNGSNEPKWVSGIACQFFCLAGQHRIREHQPSL